jgi:UDP-glucose 4-epimerase
MRILVTGARGFLGRHLLRQLAGHDVLALVRSKSEIGLGHGVREVVGDFGQSGAWVDEVKAAAPTVCVHLAWDGLPDYSLSRCRANLDAGLQFVETLTRVGVSRVVVAGTCWEYGSAQGPQSEESPGVNPGVFAATKAAFHGILDSVSREAGFDYRWARIFFSYGPGQREQSLIPYLRSSIKTGTSPALREPAAAQDFVHVGDVAGALVALAEFEGPSGAYNIGSGEPTTVGAVANYVAEYYGQPQVVEPAPVKSGMWADVSRMRTRVGWSPMVGIRDGVRQTLAALDVTR